MKNTIKSKAEIENIFKSGRRYNSKSVIVIALKNEGGRGQGGRVAFIAGKKLGSAPQRNYAKRVMRQIVSEIDIKRLTDKGYRIVFMAKKGIFEEDYLRTKKSILDLVEKMEKDE